MDFLVGILGVSRWVTAVERTLGLSTRSGIRYTLKRKQPTTHPEGQERESIPETIVVEHEEEKLQWYCAKV
jgi:hypothetical protein